MEGTEIGQRDRLPLKIGHYNGHYTATDKGLLGLAEGLEVDA
jgi:hypothetical protein